MKNINFKKKKFQYNKSNKNINYYQMNKINKIYLQKRKKKKILKLK